MDFTAGPWLCGAMRYRIDMSRSRKGYARIDFPGRILALEANRHVGPVWLVGISDIAGEAEGSMAKGLGAKGLGAKGLGAEGSVVVRAGSAGEAVWRVARAAVRAVAEITGTPPENTIGDTIESASED
jgi:hypothetical protein